jgi:hypothetical protein
MCGGNETCVEMLVGEREGKKPVSRARRRSEDNIKMELRKKGCESKDWI